MNTLYIKFKILFSVIFLIFLSSCSDSGSLSDGNTVAKKDTKTNNTILESETNTISPITIKGVLVDGYIAGATVCVDISKDERCSKDEPTTITNSKGEFSIKTDITENKPYIILASGGIDTAINAKFNSTYKAVIVPKQNKKREAHTSHLVNITPLSTLTSNIFSRKVKENPTYQISTAIESVSKSLGLPSEKLLNDPLKDIEIFGKTQEIVQTIKIISSSMRTDETNSNAKRTFDFVMDSLSDTIENSEPTGKLEIPALVSTLQKSSFNNKQIKIPFSASKAATTNVVNINKQITSLKNSSSSTKSLSSTIDISQLASIQKSTQKQATQAASNATPTQTTSAPIVIIPAPNITNATNKTFTSGTTIAPFSFTNSAGAIASCSISEALSSGLSFNTTTCMISGTPNGGALAEKIYTITATNGTGSNTATVSITINQAPAILVKPIIANVSDKTFTLQSVISTFGFPNTGGAIASCSISEALPNGLELNTSNCQISGTPINGVVAKKEYNITASNSVGSDTAIVNITINDIAPNIADISVVQTFTKNTAITPISFVNTAGAITGCEVTVGALPLGLSLNNSTCEITGTPTHPKDSKTYTIKATNIIGVSNATVTIIVNDIAPNIADISEIKSFTKNTEITPIDFINTGGEIASCAIEGEALPTGLIVNNNTCQITGTSSQVKASKEYTIKAVNTLGHNSAKVVIIVEEKAKLILSSTSVNLTEGATQAYTIKLSRQPSSDVIVTLNNPNTASATATATNGGGNTLTFTNSNWNIAQGVTITGIEDNNLTNESIIITHSSTGSGIYSSIPVENITATISDNDTGSLIISSNEISMLESSTTKTEYKIKLSHKPLADVVVSIENSDTGAVLVSTIVDGVNTLTFTPDNWNIEQSVLLSGVYDTDSNHENVTITHTTGNTGGYNNAVGVVAVGIRDYSVERLIISQSSLSVTEGSTQTYSVRPSGIMLVELIITLSVSNGGKATAVASNGGGNTLSFTYANWGTPQFVTVTGVQDDDFNNENIVIINTPSGGGDKYSNTLAEKVTASIIDDDVGSLNILQDNLTLMEGSTKNYTIALSKKPTSNVIVTISNPDTEAVSVAVNGGGNILTFTPDNWNVAQSVTITGIDDEDVNDESIIISHTTGNTGGYNSASKDVTIDIEDDETADILLSSTSLSLNESSLSSISYNAKLTYKPLTDVIITIQSNDTTRVTVATTNGGNTLTFTPSNWNIAQEVIVNGATDDDTENNNIIINHTTNHTGIYKDKTASMPISIIDADKGKLIVSISTISMKDAYSKNYTVKLSRQPSANVIVTLSSSDTESATVLSFNGSLSTLTFTPSNWDTPQYVKFQAHQDSDFLHEDFVVTHTAGSTGGYDSVNAKIDVHLIDSGVGAIDMNFPIGYSITEGSIKVYTVSLTLRPASDVTVTVSSSNPAILTAKTSTGESTLTFTPSNYHIAQNITATAIEDYDMSNSNVILTHTSNGTSNYEHSYPSELSISVMDDDVGGKLVISEATLALQEGATKTYTIKLANIPLDDVVVTISNPDTGAISATATNGGGNTLTFTPSNWNVAQSITITGVQDDDYDDESIIISHISGNTGGYNSASKNLTVSIDDDEIANLILSDTTFSIDEESTMQYTLKLSSKPLANVVVTIQSYDEKGSTAVATNGGGKTLTFTPSNWNTAQSITINGTTDDDLKDENVTVYHTTQNTGVYKNIVETITINVADNDTGRLIVSKTSLTVGEYEIGDYSVKLSNRPSADVVLTLSSSDTAKATAVATNGQGSTLTFTRNNWDKEQFITFTGLPDDDTSNENIIISNTIGSTGGYNSETKNISLTITDSNIPKNRVIVSPNPIIMKKGEEITVDFGLAHEPSESVRFSVESMDDRKVDFYSNRYREIFRNMTPERWYSRPIQVLSSTDVYSYNTGDTTIKISTDDPLYSTLNVPVTVLEPSTMQEKYITVGGVSRKFYYYVPHNVHGNPSLLFYFHGSSQTGAGNGGNLINLANKRNVIVAWPIGTASSHSGITGWTERDIEYPFFDALVEDMTTNFPNIDTNKIYATGQSSGAIFSFALAAARHSVIAAAMPVSGQLGVGAVTAFLNDGISTPIRAYNGKDDNYVVYWVASKNIKIWHEQENKGDPNDITSSTTTIGIRNVEITRFDGGISDLEFYSFVNEGHFIDWSTILDDMWEFMESHPKNNY